MGLRLFFLSLHDYNRLDIIVTIRNSQLIKMSDLHLEMSP